MTSHLFSTGYSQLDSLIGGIQPGDNMVWEIDSGVDLLPIINRYFKSSGESIQCLVSFNRSPQTMISQFASSVDPDSFVLVDCFSCGKGKCDPVFTRFYNALSKKDRQRFIMVEDPQQPDNVLSAISGIEKTIAGQGWYVFDSLTGMMELWQSEEKSLNFFTYTCPRLFDLQSVAYWIYEKKAHTDVFRARLKHVTQVVTEVSAQEGKTLLTLRKAENRKHGGIGVAVPFIFAKNDLQLEAVASPGMGPVVGARDLSHFGPNLVALRKGQHITQSELAVRIGVSASAVCQLEKGKMLPSLDLSLKIADHFRVEIDSLLRKT